LAGRRADRNYQPAAVGQLFGIVIGQRFGSP
jgi:hypothetical protein